MKKKIMVSILILCVLFIQMVVAGPIAKKEKKAGPIENQMNKARTTILENKKEKEEKKKDEKEKEEEVVLLEKKEKEKKRLAFEFECQGIDLNYQPIPWNPVIKN